MSKLSVHPIRVISGHKCGIRVHGLTTYQLMGHNWQQLKLRVVQNLRLYPNSLELEQIHVFSLLSYGFATLLKLDFDAIYSFKSALIIITQCHFRSQNVSQFPVHLLNFSFISPLFRELTLVKFRIQNQQPAFFFPLA